MTVSFASRHMVSTSQHCRATDVRTQYLRDLLLVHLALPDARRRCGA